MANLSIVIPVGANETGLPFLLKDLLAVDIPMDIILSAYEDSNIKAQCLAMQSHSDNSQIKWNVTTKGRGAQMNFGAHKATGDWLCFLHADSHIPKESLMALWNRIQASKANHIYFFNLRFFGGLPIKMALNTIGTHIRNRTWGVPYGDQGLTISKEFFHKLGGFKNSMTMGEDHEFVWRALANGCKLEPLKMPIKTNSRKYKSKGWLKTSLQHNIIGIKQAWQFGWRPKIMRINERMHKHE